MNQLPRFIQKAFRSKQKQLQQRIEFSLADQIASYIPLLELQDRRQLLQVQVLGNCHPQSYQSMIVGVDFIKQQLLLDTPSPINPYCPISVGDKLLVSHHHRGQVLAFSGFLTNICTETDSKDQDSLIYLMDLPKDIAYKQRRFYPRLVFTTPLSTPTIVQAKLKSPLKMPWHCSLKNISAGGIRVSVPGNVSPQLAVGSILPRADILLDNLKISCRLLIKSFRHERRPYEHTEISLSFSDIGFQDRLRLQNYISFHLEENHCEALSFAS